MTLRSFSIWSKEKKAAFFIKKDIFISILSCKSCWVLNEVESFMPRSRKFIKFQKMCFLELMMALENYAMNVQLKGWPNYLRCWSRYQTFLSTKQVFLSLCKSVQGFAGLCKSVLVCASLFKCFLFYYKKSMITIP